MSDSTHDARQPLDLHAAALASEAAGFTRPVQLQSHQMAHLARSLRGIDAVQRILISETGDDGSDTAMVLGDNLRMGLLEAVGVILANTQEMLEQAHDNAKAASGAVRNLR